MSSSKLSQRTARLRRLDRANAVTTLRPSGRSALRPAPRSH